MKKKSYSKGNKEGWGFIFGFVAISSFSLTLPITRFLTRSLSPWEIGLGRSLLASLAAVFILIITRQKIPTMNSIKKLMLIASGITLGFPILTAVGMKTIPASHGAVILGALPLATVLFSCLHSGEKPSYRFWMVSLVGFCLISIYSVIKTENTTDIHFYLGDLALIIAVLLAGLGYAQGGILAQTLGGWQVICWTLVVSLPILVPLMFLTFDLQNFLAMSPVSWWSFVFLALMNSLIGFFFWYHGLALGGVARVSQVQYFQIFMTGLFSFLLLGEVITFTTLLFMILMMVVVIIGRRMPIRKQPE